jgi:hypothetical protein
MKMKNLLLIVLAFAFSASLWAQETVPFTNVDSQASSGVVSYDVTLTGGYDLGIIDWDGIVNVLAAGTYGSELKCEVSGPLGTTILTLGSGTSYASGTNFTDNTSYFNGLGDPAGTWSFDFYESYDDGADGLPDANWSSIDFTFNVELSTFINWCNLQWPGNGAIASGDPFNVYAFAWIDGVTNDPGVTPGLECWIGYSTADTDPSTWSNWVPASFQGDNGNNDEFVADIGSVLGAGSYYYASRFSYNLGAYYYGGFQGGFWDGISNVSGTLTVSASLGDDCSAPILINVPNELSYSDLNQTTCGRTDDYDATCFGSYDNGEDIIYELNVTTDVVVSFEIDPKGTTYSGIVLFDDCPDSGIETCLASSTAGSSGSAHSFTYPLTVGTYYFMVDTWSTPDCIPDFDLVLTEVNTTLDFYNLQWPGSGTIEQYENLTVYAQCFEAGVTPPAGPGAGIECWIGYSTSDTDPATWTNWILASYNFGIDPNNNDEYQVDLGANAGMGAGTYYYASRFSYNSGPYTYGGFNGGAWDGITNVSGVLTINPCSVASIPYFENFDAVVSPVMPPCMTVENTNGDAYTWATNTSYDLSPPNCAAVRWNTSEAMDDWLFTEGLQLTAGVTYEVGFAYGAASSTSFDEKLAVYWGTGPTSADMVNGPIFDENFLGAYYFGSGSFTPTADGVYYVGFHGYSDADQFYLLLDDMYVNSAVASATWTGAIDNNWWNPGNWDGSIAPTATTDVTIPAGLTNYPTVTSVAACHNIYFESTAAHTATILDNGLLVITGTATVDRYFSGNDLDWHLVSSPISNAQAGVFMDMYLQSFDPTAPQTPPENGYVEIIDPITPLNVMEGYALYSTLSNANTVSFVGNLNIGPKSKLLSYEATNNPNGWNLLGNPYPSSLNWEAVSIPTNMTTEVHYIEAATGADLSYVKGSGGTGSQYIAPMQGFFVSTAASATLSINSAVRTHAGADNWYKSTPDDLVILKAAGNDFSNETWVFFNADAEAEHDGVFDAYKRITAVNPALPQIYTITPSGVKLDVNGMPANELVPVGFIAGIDGTYSISAIETSEFSDVVLEDMQTGAMTNLLNGAYSFAYSAGEPEDRFILHFTPLSVEDELESMFNIYSFANDVYVGVPENTNGTISIFNMMGQEVANNAINGTMNIVRLNKSAYYVVKVTSNDTVVTRKVFVK